MVKNRYSGFLSLSFFVVMLLLVCVTTTNASQIEEKEGDGNLALRAALAHTYINNPTIQAARAEYRSVQERLPQARSGWKPTVGASGNVTNTDLSQSDGGSDDNTTSRNVALSLEQPIYRGGSTFAEVAAAKAVISAQWATLVQTEQNILLAAATAYMDTLRDQAVLELSINNRDVLKKQLEAAQDRFDVGELTKTDTSQAKARHARAESEVITARGDVRTSNAVFEEVIGDLPQNLLDPDMSKFIVPQSLDEALLAAEDKNPQLLAVRFAHQAAEKDVDDVFGELLPAVRFVSEWNKTFDPSPGLYDNQTTRTVGLTASIPLYQAGSTRSRVRQAKYTANQRYIEIVEAKRDVKQKVIAAWEDLSTAEAEIKSRVAEVQAAATANEGVKAENEFGSRTVLDALDAEQEYLDAQVSLVIAERNRVVATFELLALLSALTPETLGFDRGEFSYRPEHTGWEFDLFDVDVDRIGGKP